MVPAGGAIVGDISPSMVTGGAIELLWKGG